MSFTTISSCFRMLTLTLFLGSQLLAALGVADSASLPTPVVCRYADSGDGEQAAISCDVVLGASACLDVPGQAGLEADIARRAQRAARAILHDDVAAAVGQIREQLSLKKFTKTERYTRRKHTDGAATVNLRIERMETFTASSEIAGTDIENVDPYALHYFLFPMQLREELQADGIALGRVVVERFDSDAAFSGDPDAMDEIEEYLERGGPFGYSRSFSSASGVPSAALAVRLLVGAQLARDGVFAAVKPTRAGSLTASLGGAPTDINFHPLKPLPDGSFHDLPATLRRKARHWIRLILQDRVPSTTAQSRWQTDAYYEARMTDLVYCAILVVVFVLGAVFFRFWTLKLRQTREVELAQFGGAGGGSGALDGIGDETAACLDEGIEECATNNFEDIKIDGAMKRMAAAGGRDAGRSGNDHDAQAGAASSAATADESGSLAGMKKPILDDVE